MGIQAGKRDHLKSFGCRILIIAAALLAASCTQGREQAKDTGIHIRTQSDVLELRRTESLLAITPEKAEVNPDFQVIENLAVPFVPEYRVGPGDIIEVVYHIRYEATPDAYRLEVQDRISINFPFHPQFSTTALIRTDGKITVPLLGDVRAESRTPEELAAALNKGYAKYIDNPSITVALEDFNVKIEELKRAITTAPRGQSKIAPITPDGRISFPIIGNIPAEGFTLSQLEGAVNEKYSNYIRNLQVTLILMEIHHAKVYVVGEVERPGVYEMQSRLDLLSALALAGGSKKSALLRDVIVFRNDGLEKPIAFRVDLEAALKRGVTYAGLQVRPADIIFVPKTKLDRFDDLVEKVFTKGLYAIVPFSSAFNIYYDISPDRIR